MFEVIFFSKRKSTMFWAFFSLVYDWRSLAKLLFVAYKVRCRVYRDFYRGWSVLSFRSSKIPSQMLYQLFILRLYLWHLSFLWNCSWNSPADPAKREHRSVPFVIYNVLRENMFLEQHELFVIVTRNLTSNWTLMIRKLTRRAGNNQQLNHLI